MDDHRGGLDGVRADPAGHGAERNLRPDGTAERNGTERNDTERETAATGLSRTQKARVRRVKPEDDSAGTAIVLREAEGRHFDVFKIVETTRDANRAAQWIRTQPVDVRNLTRDGEMLERDERMCMLDLRHDPADYLLGTHDYGADGDAEMAAMLAQRTFGPGDGRDPKPH